MNNKEYEELYYKVKKIAPSTEIIINSKIDIFQKIKEKTIQLSFNDFRKNKFQDDEIFSLEGFKIMITHGHLYGARYDTDELASAAKEEGCDIVVYGHTHVADNHYQDGILVLNPGSATLPRDGMRPSFMILNLEEGKTPEVELYRFILWRKENF